MDLLTQCCNLRLGLKITLVKYLCDDIYEIIMVTTNHDDGNDGGNGDDYDNDEYNYNDDDDTSMNSQ